MDDLRALDAALTALEQRWGITRHTAAHLLRLVGEVGGRTTSGRRSREQNRRVGGSVRSHHLRGCAVDHVPPRRHWRRAYRFLERDRCSDNCTGVIELLDERDHIHYAVAP